MIELINKHDESILHCITKVVTTLVALGERASILYSIILDSRKVSRIQCRQCFFHIHDNFARRDLFLLLIHKHLEKTHLRLYLKISALNINLFLINHLLPRAPPRRPPDTPRFVTDDVSNRGLLDRLLRGLPPGLWDLLRGRLRPRLGDQ